VSVTADEALRRLTEGNERFLRGEARFSTVQKDVLAKLATAQRPFATVFGCSDSRVPPELLFDAGFGELVVIRVAGHVLSTGVLGTLQYAALHLRTPLFVVLGHERCGAIKAALATQLHGHRDRERIQALVDEIVKGLPDPDRGVSHEAQLDRAVEANVRSTVRLILETPEARARVAEGRVRLVGAVVEIATGRVRFLSL
jgi:carbonic anhydrase